jgi:hypothetical protein
MRAALLVAKLDEDLERRWRGKVRRGLALQLSRRAENSRFRNSSYFLDPISPASTKLVKPNGG